MRFIDPPKKPPLWVKLLIWIGDKAVGRKLTPPRLLAWYPKALLGSGLLEGFITHKDKTINHRLLQLIRMQVSFTVACPFCIDLNSTDFSKNNITDDEIKALQGLNELSEVLSFSIRERTALEYAKAICQTPIRIEKEVIDQVKKAFSEREMVIIASTAAQVNYWTRLIQAFGIQPDGFMDNCPILRLDDYQNWKK